MKVHNESVRDQSQFRASQREPKIRLTDVAWLLLFLCLMLPYIQVLTAIWMGSGSRSAASLVAFLGFAVFSVLQFRTRPTPEPPRHTALASVLLAGATLLYVASVGHDVIVGMGLSGFIIYSVLLYLRGGSPWLWSMRYPLGLFILVIPIPGFLMGAITHGLLIAATAISSVMLSWVLSGVTVQGFHIQFDTGSIAIVSSCSGLSGILMLIPLTVIFASVFKPVGWLRLGIGIVLALALAFASNLFRILSTALLVHWDSPMGASESAHEVLGSIPLLLSMALLIYYFYRSSETDGAKKEESTERSPNHSLASDDPASTDAVPLRPGMARGAIALLAMGCLLLVLGRSRIASRTFDFTNYERDVKLSFEGTELAKVRFEAENLLPDDYLCLEQSDPDKPFFSVYIGYFPREALVEKAQHDPRVCYATLGWEQLGKVTPRTLKSSTGERVEVQALLFRTGELERVVWFWVQRGDALDAHEGASRSPWDLLWSPRSDSAWIRLELDPELTGEDWEQAWADKILDLRDTVRTAMD